MLDKQEDTSGTPQVLDFKVRAPIADLEVVIQVLDVEVNDDSRKAMPSIAAGKHPTHKDDDGREWTGAYAVKVRSAHRDEDGTVKSTVRVVAVGVDEFDGVLSKIAKVVNKHGVGLPVQLAHVMSVTGYQTSIAEVKASMKGKDGGPPSGIVTPLNGDGKSGLIHPDSGLPL